MMLHHSIFLFEVVNFMHNIPLIFELASLYYVGLAMSLDTCVRVDRLVVLQ